MVLIFLPSRLPNLWLLELLMKNIDCNIYVVFKMLSKNMSNINHNTFDMLCKKEISDLTVDYLHPPCFPSRQTWSGCWVWTQPQTWQSPAVSDRPPHPAASLCLDWPLHASALPGPSTYIRLKSVCNLYQHCKIFNLRWMRSHYLQN